MSNRHAMTVRARRASAAARGLCSGCCTAVPVPNMRQCVRCLESSRRSRALRYGRTYTPIYSIAGRRAGRAPRPAPRFIVHGRLPAALISHEPFDLAADRREEAIALSELTLMRKVGRW